MVMGRNRKVGLDYFPMDVDFFQDIRIRKLIKYQGGKAVTVYALLLCIIYKQGYYVRWDDELPFIISEQTGFEEAYIQEVFKCCLIVGLFSKKLYDSDKVITSKGIQERYKSICDQLRRVCQFDEFGLISSEEIGISSEEIGISSEEIGISSEKKPINSAKSTQKKRKGNNKENSINRVKEKMGSDFGSCDIPLSELQHELSADSGWEEAIRLHLYRNGIKVFDHDMFLLWLDKFVISLKAGGTISKDRKGFMEHFRNWILTEIKRGATNLFQDTNDALLKSSECNKTYHKFLSYIKKQAPYCFSNMRLPTEEEFLLLRDKYGNDMFKNALCTIEGRVDIRSKWDVLYNAVLKQFEFMKDEK